MATPHQHQPPVRNGLLAALPPEDLARLRPSLQPVELPFDHTLYPADGIVEAVLFIETGMVSLLATLEDGEQVEVGIAGREGLIGLPLVLGDDRSLVEARVQMEGTALRMDAAAFRDEMEGSAALRGLLLRYALAFHAQVTHDRRMQRAPRHRAAPRPLAADRARPRRGGRVRHDPRVHVDDARRAPPRRVARRGRAPEGRADPLRPGPDGHHRPARPRSRHLRVLPHRRREFARLLGSGTATPPG